MEKTVDIAAEAMFEKKVASESEEVREVDAAAEANEAEMANVPKPIVEDAE